MNGVKRIRMVSVLDSRKLKSVMDPQKRDGSPDG